MSITVTREKNGLIVAEIKGVYTYDDQKQVENQSGHQGKLEGKVNILILAQEFAGWGKEGDWGDLSFMYAADPHINRIALVAEKKWKDQLLMFLGAGRRQASVKYFQPGEIEAARHWLGC